MPRACISQCGAPKPVKVGMKYTPSVWLTAAAKQSHSAERLMMPSVLNGALSLTECDRLTRAGRLDDVLEENARIVLMGHMGLSQADCNLLKNIWVKMRDRRMARRRRKVAVVDVVQ